ncbi:MAG: type II secretion system ATPase GspE [Xanthomonadales bacterium]|uniref:type II secretion system ATPase GspE n=1 Tax=Hydrogenophaga sp. TaxID=1904254 RepID=UPI00169ACB1F|nr:type II secretion system ATPase GspE [Hydrogenophaga sp.]NIM69168.1 type II secretion system ATPase GspE [Xanthomonadales bacterium]NIN31191.1 type II secretion system ATPase GspE [Hydrogenophaga sp.]NIN58461.1 type II secretion system ATPase GspE [Xanthomonadales bacterium]NIN73783.1 type II secretion system ATPase GspE [Xanthomonadales bacterium]NIO13760.1 type II secretion system ATPase GspE [Xanthomonadales bacterium]
MAIAESEHVTVPAARGGVGDEVCAYLLEKERLKPADLKRAEAYREQHGGDLITLLVRLGLVSERDVAETESALLHLQLVRTADLPDEPPQVDGLSLRFLKQNLLLPIAASDTELSVVMANPRDTYALQALAMASGKQVVPSVGIASEIENGIEKLYGGGRSAMGQIVESLGGESEADLEDVEHLRDLASEAPVIRLVNLILQRAVEARASDIHIEPFENRLKVRYRIDGVLQEVEAPPYSSTAAVISRIKIMAKLNIAERRLPQDGRIMHRVQGKELDLRVSTVPTSHGESVVMRILDRESIVLDFDSLGFDDALRKAFIRVLEMPHGIILVTGPTGSGKTTTLYTALSQLNTPERKIITVEDPVEYQLEGINQIQAKSSIGLDFAHALRAIVRQDPDVIMIGEMRDLETAQIAIQSALTGHLVLSTVHTNDAAGGITRMLDMGVEDYLLTSTVNAILAQRLVRTLHPDHREAVHLLPEVAAEIGLASLVEQDRYTVYRPVPSEDNPGGYLGRTSIMELLVMSDPIRRLVMRHATSGEIQQQAIGEGMRTMYQDGLLKCLRGVTSVEEVLRVTQEA